MMQHGSYGRVRVGANTAHLVGRLMKQRRSSRGVRPYTPAAHLVGWFLPQHMASWVARACTTVAHFAGRHRLQCGSSRGIWRAQCQHPQGTAAHAQPRSTCWHAPRRPDTPQLVHPPRHLTLQDTQRIAVPTFSSRKYPPAGIDGGIPMAMFHIAVDRIVKGKTAGGATGFARYIAREAPDRATQHARYLTRESHPDTHDLVAAGAAQLPSWAQDATHFFTLADRYERQGGIVARTYEIALPRELTPGHRQELADDIRAAFFAQHPHAWAIHNPVARDGGEQPHVHLMVSERLVDGVARAPQQFFRRAAPQGTDPATGGARKELHWNTPTVLVKLRLEIATLTNAALERAGHAVAVSAETLHARGFARAPEQDQGSKARYLHAKHGIETPGWQATLARRETLHREYHPWENETNRAAWYAQKQREGLRDISREAMVEHVRARFWAHDRSPIREQQRTNAFLNQVGWALQQAQQATTREQSGHDTPARRETRPRHTARPPSRAAAPALHLTLDGDDTPVGGVRWHARDQRPDLERDGGLAR